MGRLKTRLIDAQDAFNVLSDYYHHSTHVQHLALQEALNKVPTVDAVPIEWLIRMRNKHNNDGFAWIYEAVMDDWREEHAETD